MLRTFRRALLVVSVAGAVAAAFRARASSEPSPPHGAWRELSGPDLR